MNDTSNTHDRDIIARLIADAHALQLNARKLAHLVSMPHGGNVIAIGTPGEVLALLAARREVGMQVHTHRAPVIRTYGPASGDLPSTHATRAPALHPSDEAIAAGRTLAHTVFSGRKGHGGAPVQARAMSHPELAALLACVFQLGMDTRTTVVGHSGGPGVSAAIDGRAAAPPSQPGIAAPGRVEPGRLGTVPVRPDQGEAVPDDPHMLASATCRARKPAAHAAQSIYEFCTHPRCAHFEDAAGWSCRARRDNACHAEHAEQDRAPCTRPATAGIRLADRRAPLTSADRRGDAPCE